jgi:hypothetical protein
MITQDALGILGSPSFVAAPKIAISQAIKEEKPAEDEEKSGGAERIEVRSWMVSGRS